MPTRRTRQIEGKLLGEYLVKTYPQYPRIVAQPLGKVPDNLLVRDGL